MPPEQPNVLFVMTDQQRFDTIAALGHDHVHTPNLDRLADRGVACTNAYSSAPVCVPARHNIRTGCDPIRTGYIGNDKRHAEHLEDECGPFLARAMRQRGYRTFGIGKFHAHPSGIDLGYDTRLTGSDYRDDFSQTTYDADQGRTAAMNMLPQSSPLDPEQRRMSWISDRTVEQLEGGPAAGSGDGNGNGDSRDGEDAPFFGLVSFSKPHPGWNPSPPFDEIYDPDGMPDAIRENRELDHLDEKIPAQNYHFWKSRADDTSPETIRAARAHYYGLVTQLDRELGRILDQLEARGDAENTLVCFFSDHGELLGDHHGWGKTSFFEASTRVPFLLSWPDELPAGERYDGLVSLTDLVGIATRAAGDPEYRDGEDVIGAIRGETDPRRRLFGYHETPLETDHFSIPRNFTVMVREGDWKYVHAVNGGRELLTNVTEDPRETRNYRDDRPAVLARLREAAAENLRAHDAEEYLGSDGESLREEEFERLEMGRYGTRVYPDSAAAGVPDRE